jgi:hypothetical protein
VVEQGLKLLARRSVLGTLTGEDFEASFVILLVFAIWCL